MLWLPTIPTATSGHASVGITRLRHRSGRELSCASSVGAFTATIWRQRGQIGFIVPPVTPSK
jgi:hypothetical protein